MEAQLPLPPTLQKVKVTEGYVDLLAERRDTSDLRWAIREWESRGDYRYGCSMSRKEIFDHVVKSDRVRHTINKVLYVFLFFLNELIDCFIWKIYKVNIYCLTVCCISLCLFIFRW